MGNSGIFSDQNIVDGQAKGKNVPFTWIPITPPNPSKLTLHYFKNGEWVPTSFVRLVLWPEAFPSVEKSGGDAA